MRVKVLSIALLGAIVAVPVPASQVLVGTFPSSAPAAPAAISAADLATLLADPFLIDRLSYAPPARIAATEVAKAPAGL